MGLSPEEIRRIADLARLDLPPDRVGAYADQLDAILAHVAQLGEAASDDADRMMHAAAAEDVFRDDEPVPGLSNEDALANAPDREDGQFRVPKTV